MRAIYFPEIGTRFDPNVREIERLLPEVKELTITFQRNSPAELNWMDLAQEVRLVFKNKKKLVIPGYFLWKYRDNIPPELGSDDYGYLDVNPFCAGTCEALHKRIKSAHDVMFVVAPNDLDQTTPISATFGMKNLRIDIIRPGTVSDDDYAYILGYCDKEKALKKTKDWLKKTIRHALQNKRVSVEMYEISKGVIGNRFVERTWPKDAMTKMTVSEFLKEAEMPTETPYLQTWAQLMSYEIVPLTNAMFADALSVIRKENPTRFSRIAASLRINPETKGKFNKKATIEAINFTDRRDRLTDEVWNRLNTDEISISHFLAENIR